MSEFKDMKFLIGDDRPLLHAVKKTLFSMGYDTTRGLDDFNGVIVAYHDGSVVFDHSIHAFDSYDCEEINIDWMRTNEPETINISRGIFEELDRIKSDFDEVLDKLLPERNK